MPNLFDPIQFGAISAPSRIIMAPLTRSRADRDGVPTPVMAEYYAQRAGAGLIVSEASGISRQGLGWPFAPGLWTDAQVAGWKPVTRAVHEAGGRIVAQLWHMGRQVHSSVTGEQPVSASATTQPGTAHTYAGKQSYEPARALDAAEIPGIIEGYARAAENALRAGFDGVQVHAANGYLIDQFLRDGSNLRDDNYGGGIDGRIRLLNDVTERVIGVAGADRTTIRLSPVVSAQGVGDSDPQAVFVPAARRLSELGIALLDLLEVRPDGPFAMPPVTRAIRQVFKRPLSVGAGYATLADAQAALDSGVADAVSFGRTFIANPDLPERLRTGAPLNEGDMATWYTQGREGYVDYPALGG